jgi:hypothetical protein
MTQEEIKGVSKRESETEKEQKQGKHEENKSPVNPRQKPANQAEVLIGRNKPVKNDAKKPTNPRNI